MGELQGWNEDLYECCDDCGLCLFGYCCPSCLFGYNASKLDGRNGCVMCCIHYSLNLSYLAWIVQYFQRQKLRQRYGLTEDRSCTDIPAVICCGPCALCQEAREMKARGFIAEGARINKSVAGPGIITSEPTYPVKYQNDYSTENKAQIELARM